MDDTLFMWIFIGLCTLGILCIALLPYFGLSLQTAIFMCTNLLIIELFLLYMYYTTSYKLNNKQV
jgi:hypothetical protein